MPIVYNSSLYYAQILLLSIGLGGTNQGRGTGRHGVKVMCKRHCEYFGNVENRLSGNRFEKQLLHEERNSILSYC